jgi:hypothetical protein
MRVVRSDHANNQSGPKNLYHQRAARTIQKIKEGAVTVQHLGLARRHASRAWCPIRESNKRPKDWISLYTAQHSKGSQDGPIRAHLSLHGSKHACMTQNIQRKTTPTHAYGCRTIDEKYGLILINIQQ